MCCCFSFQNLLEFWDTLLTIIYPFATRISSSFNHWKPRQGLLLLSSKFWILNIINLLQYLFKNKFTIYQRQNLLRRLSELCARYNPDQLRYVTLYINITYKSFDTYSAKLGLFHPPCFITQTETMIIHGITNPSEAWAVFPCVSGPVT
jgi:hypothetical protein